MRQELRVNIKELDRWAYIQSMKHLTQERVAFRKAKNSISNRDAKVIGALVEHIKRRTGMGPDMALEVVAKLALFLINQPGENNVGKN